MKTVIKELEGLSENASKKLLSDLELFFCNCNLDKQRRKDLINIINKNIFDKDDRK